MAALIPAVLDRSWLAICTPIPILAIIFFWKNRLLPRFSGYSRFRVISVVALYASSFFYLLPQNQFSGHVSGALSTLFGLLHAPPIPDPLGFNATIVFLVLAAVLTLNLLWYANEISHTLANPVVEGLPSRHRDFQASLNRYCTALIAELDRYDREVNWSDYELTPLEAEVETERSARLRPRIASDLLEAIRRDRTSAVFLVLGDPGSGKSVSLRRLVRLLCRQAQDTGVVPVYVNLREYPVGEGLTTDSLVRFIRETALRQTGRDGRAFIDAWYEVFRRSGRLFFIIDSFDEVPAVLDCDDRSEAHKEISASFDRFFTQEVQTCRAVLSSRHFRAPVGVKGTRLVIRPFSESQIRRAMRTWLLGQGIDSTNYIRRLFRERPHLVPLLRNPFTAELIAEYARTSAGEKLPDSMFSVFDHYLTERFASDQSALERLKLSPKNLRDAAGLIARRMYESADIGLEADVERIASLLGNSLGKPAIEIIEALRYTRIARVGGHDRRRFSFVHRRFAEFFVVDHMRRGKERPQIESIPSDSRWRDCLVMYCGIADLPIRQQIAEFCWSVIAASRHELLEGRVLEARDAVHCSRFLAEAFRSDPDATGSFRSLLGEVVAEFIGSKDLLTAKIAAEMIPLLDEAHQQLAINSAFETDSPWICDTTLGSCRHLGKLDDGTNQRMRSYLRSIPAGEFLHRFSDLSFSMSLSDAFRKQRRNLWVDLGEVALLPCAAALLLCLGAAWFPRAVMYSAVMGSLFAVFLWLSSLASSIRSARPRERDGPAARSGARRTLRRIRSVTQFALGARRLDFVSKGLRIFVGMASYILVIGLLTGHWYFDLARDLTIQGRTTGIRDFMRIWAMMPVVFGLWGMLVASLRIIFIPPAFDNLQLLVIAKRAVKFVIVIATIGAVLGGVGWFLFWSLPKLWNMLPAPARKYLTYGFWGVMALFYTLGGIGLLVRIVKAGVQNAIDRTRLNRNGFPTRVSSSEAYSACLSFRSREVRRLYLEGLRRRRIPLIGEVTPAPEELLESGPVAEELARLREQWLGLAG